MLQNPDGESFQKPLILSTLQHLQDEGVSDPCGSIPTGWPEDSSTAGHMAVNSVSCIPCEASCADAQDQLSRTIRDLRYLRVARQGSVGCMLRSAGKASRL